MATEPKSASRLRLVQRDRVVPQPAAAETGILIECVTDTTCAHCGGTVPLGDAKPLTTLRCPSCRGEITVPGRVGGFLLRERIGEGEMGAIYRATDESLNRDVAIKVVRGCHADNPASRERLRQEACAAGRLNHPRVAQVHALGFSNSHPYLVMELVTGEDFSQKLRREGHIDERTALRMALDVAAGLSALEREGLVHGDIKPGNIVLDRDGNAKLVDFGLSGMTRRDGSGTLAGTPHYIAPELLRGAADTNRSDIYSLGATLYHLLSGRTPFDGETPADVVNARLFQQPTPLGTHARHVSMATRKLVMRMLESSPEKRQANSETVAAELRLALAQLDLPARETPGTPTALPLRSGFPGWLVPRRTTPYPRGQKVAAVILGLVAAVEFMIAARVFSYEQPLKWARQAVIAPARALRVSLADRNKPAAASTATDYTTDTRPVWRSMDLGAGTQHGSTLQMGETLLVQGAGLNMWAGNDRCRFVWAQASNTYALSVQVKTIAQREPLAATGLMVRGEDPNRGPGLLFGFRGNGELFLQTRPLTGKPLVVKRSGEPLALPCHLRIIRCGPAFEAAVSVDGLTWTRFAACELDLPACNTVGLCVAAQSPSTLATAEFAEVHLMTPAHVAAPL